MENSTQNTKKVAWNASIYQTSKDGTKTNWQQKLSGENYPNEINNRNLAELMGVKLYHWFNAQEKMKARTGKTRFFSVTKGRPVYFFFYSEIFELETELNQELSVKIKIGDATQAQFIDGFEIFLDVATVQSSNIDLSQVK